MAPARSRVVLHLSVRVMTTLITNNSNDADLPHRLVNALRTVTDPEIPINLYDLGLIYEVAVDPEGRITATMSLTTPNCPIAGQIPQQVKRALEAVEGVRSAEVRLVWEPRWNAEMMSEEAKLQMEMAGISWSDLTPGGGGGTRLTIGRGGSAG
jgi:FeS assembly SUF system protein